MVDKHPFRYNSQTKIICEWCQPDLQASVEEENLSAIVGVREAFALAKASPLENRLLMKDVLDYLLI